MTLGRTRTADRASAAPESLPALDELLDRVGSRIDPDRRAAILTVTVLQRSGSVDPAQSWSAYEDTIRHVADFLVAYRSQRMRRDDHVFEPSVNGNAFVILLEPPRSGRAIDASDVARVRMRLKRGLRAHLGRVLSRETSESFGCYVGGAFLHHDEAIRLERRVHRALQEAFADALRDKEREGRRHAVQLHRVLDQGLVRTVYQPVVDLARRRVLGYEALTRVGVGRFENVEMLFKAAEENDVLWALERLCRRKAIEGLPHLEPDQCLFLNVEPDAIHDPHLVGSDFLDRLRAAGLGPRQVVLELTEHAAVKDYAAFRRTLLHFREQGFRLAMDDVGAGYAGLHAIAEIGPDFIKADMMLVRDLHRSVIKRELIATMTRFAQNTGITMVAEGVEERDELATLMELGVRCAQGYLFARPTAPPQIPDWSTLP
ncbi:MAG TPA: EAL domain-containing protein [Candidatus Polarisedimenticolaceae bacterium]